MKIKKLCLIMVLVMLAIVFAACKIEVDTSELEVKCEYDVISIGEINPLEIKSTNAYEIKSSDESIATIEDDNVIGKAEGKVTITVTSKNLKSEVEITVIDASISLKNNSIEVKPNQEVDLNAYFSCNLSTNITYNVSDTTILNLQNGKVTALKEGSTYVFASYKQNNTTLSKTLEITVLEDIDIESEDYDEAVYLGIFNYGAVTSLEMDNFVYRFFINGSEQKYKIKKVGAYEIQNILEEGCVYKYTLENGVISSLVKLDNQETFASTKTSSVIRGKVQNISANFIEINDQTYRRLSKNNMQINKKAGGATVVQSATIANGDTVIITLTKNGYAKSVFKVKEVKDYSSPVTGVAGERTLTNFFKTAFSAVGIALYVYGGNWNFQDNGSANAARTIGISQSWVDFFYENDGTYDYKNTNKALSYYPFGSYNEYYYAGVDCSGYVGWIVYNVLNTENGHDGYVMSSTKMAKHFAELKMGTYTRDYSAPTSAKNDFKVGDIISTDGHVWVCLGVCSDGSMVILHSTPSTSYNGKSGGGAQIGAIGSSESCQAFILADSYNKKYYKDWADRYPTALKSYSAFLKRDNANAGKFSWTIGASGLTDPDNLSTKSPEEILKVIFGE